MTKRGWKFAAFLVIVSAVYYLAGCEVNALEKSSSNSNANPVNGETQRSAFASVNSNPNSANSNSGAVNVNSNSSVEEIVKQAATEISQNLQNSAIVQSNSNQTDLTKNLAGNAQFASAAAQNLNLSKNLVWTFGGRAQTGWYIYKPLLCQTIGVEIGASDNDFAANLAAWQKVNGLVPNGILDGATLAALVAKWQANRLKVHGYADPNELSIEPTADFYDPSRPEQLRQVEHETYAAYKKLVAAAIADKSLNLANNNRGELASSEKFLKIVSAYRSKDYQDKLRRESPNSGRAGLAVGNSPHFTGRALDLYVGGEPVTTKDENRAVQVNTVVYRWLVKNAGKFGFKPYFYEPWHWEYAP